MQVINGSHNLSNHTLCDHAPPEHIHCTMNWLGMRLCRLSMVQHIPLPFSPAHTWRLQQYLYWSGSRRFGVSESSVREPRPCTHSDPEQTTWADEQDRVRVVVKLAVLTPYQSEWWSWSVEGNVGSCGWFCQDGPPLSHTATQQYQHQPRQPGGGRGRGRGGAGGGRGRQRREKSAEERRQEREKRGKMRR